MNGELNELTKKWRKQAAQYRERAKGYTGDYQGGLASACDDCADELDDCLTNMVRLRSEKENPVDKLNLPKDVEEAIRRYLAI